MRGRIRRGQPPVQRDGLLGDLQRLGAQPQTGQHHAEQAERVAELRAVRGVRAGEPAVQAGGLPGHREGLLRAAESPQGRGEAHQGGAQRRGEARVGLLRAAQGHGLGGGALALLPPPASTAPRSGTPGRGRARRPHPGLRAARPGRRPSAPGRAARPRPSPSGPPRAGRRAPVGRSARRPPWPGRVPRRPSSSRRAWSSSPSRTAGAARSAGRRRKLWCRRTGPPRRTTPSACPRGAAPEPGAARAVRPRPGERGGAGVVQRDCTNVWPWWPSAAQERFSAGVILRVLTTTALLLPSVPFLAGLVIVSWKNQ